MTIDIFETISQRIKLLGDIELKQLKKEIKNEKRRRKNNKIQEICVAMELSKKNYMIDIACCARHWCGIAIPSKDFPKLFAAGYNHEEQYMKLNNEEEQLFNKLYKYSKFTIIDYVFRYTKYDEYDNGFFKKE